MKGNGMSAGISIVKYTLHKESAELERFLSLQGVTVVHSAEQGYLETDGTLTNDIFLFGKRL